jgi:hypothetical protein
MAIVFTNLAFSVPGDTFSLHFEYSDLCTDFDIPGDDPYSGGRALVYGGTAYGVTLGSTLSVGSAPNLTLTVTDATSTVVYMTGAASFSYAGYTGNTAYSAVVSMMALSANPTESTVSGCLGICYSAFGGCYSSDGATSPFVVDRGFSCPV